MNFKHLYILGVAVKSVGNNTSRQLPVACSNMLNIQLGSELFCINPYERKINIFYAQGVMP